MPCILWACAPESSGRPQAALGVPWGGQAGLEGTLGEMMVSPPTLAPWGFLATLIEVFSNIPKKS